MTRTAGMIIRALRVRELRSYDCIQAEKEGTVEPLVPWTVIGRPADGRRRRACRQRRRKKNHLIEAAPFGRLDQM